MPTIRRTLACGALLALALGVSAADQAETPLERTAEYKHSSHVLEGTVTSIDFLDEDGARATAGPRFGLKLKVDGVHKTKEKDKPAKGDEVSLRGRTTDKEKKKKYLVPRARDRVIAFVGRRDKDEYEVLEPVGFRISD